MFLTFVDTGKLTFKPMKEYHILNLGAGVQSTCLFLLAKEPSPPFHLDITIFANTQEEPSDIYKHLNYLQSLPPPPRIIVCTAGKLGNDMINGYGPKRHFVSIPAFVKDDGTYNQRHCAQGKYKPPTRFMMTRQCSNHYKIKIINKIIRQEVLGLKCRQKVPKDVIIYQYFGFSADIDHAYH